MSTAVSIVPSNLQLPAHLQSPDIAAAIAAANAAATGGVRSGGFPSIGIKANKFSIKDGDETTVLMMAPAAAGQPPLPMMCLEIVVVDANPALSHTFFEDEYVEGEHLEPTCRSANGVTPDADVVAKQNPVCATCPQYAWGSKISKLTGKPVRACGDSKQLAVLPANDLNFKMLGLAVKAGSLKNWGSYVSALSGRGYGIATLVTNVTFDQTANGVLQFSFNRFLTEAEFIRVNERKTGDDVRLITAQSRGAAVPALAAPANLGLPAPDVAAPAYVAPAAATGQTGGFGASQITDPAYLAAQAAENARAHALAAAAATPPARPPRRRSPALAPRTGGGDGCRRPGDPRRPAHLPGADRHRLHGTDQSLSPGGTSHGPLSRDPAGGCGPRCRACQADAPHARRDGSREGG
ncbi:MAG: hypothetical protein IPM06_21900 [Rhizobiales bacterium]|nr:hypothetical protein [Hyphomicrobiales bacterium]